MTFKYLDEVVAHTPEGDKPATRRVNMSTKMVEIVLEDESVFYQYSAGPADLIGNPLWGMVVSAGF